MLLLVVCLSRGPVFYLQRIEALLTTKYKAHEIDTFLPQYEGNKFYQAIKIILRSFLRSGDAEFGNSLHSINRRYRSFQEEVTSAHRQNLENHVVQQNAADIAVRGALCERERNVLGGSALRLDKGCSAVAAREERLGARNSTLIRNSE